MPQLELHKKMMTYSLELELCGIALQVQAASYWFSCQAENVHGEPIIDRARAYS
jgi:hypothetical protein